MVSRLLNYATISGRYGSLPLHHINLSLPFDSTNPYQEI
jgi:hypothetical protein